MTPIEKQQLFHKELKELLVKHKAKIMIEDFSRGYHLEQRMVVYFGYDQALFDEHRTGIIPGLVLGTFEDGIS